MAILSYDGNFSVSGTSIAPVGAVAAVDLNGDGYDDLIVAEKDSGQDTGSELVAYLNNASYSNPGFGSAQTVYTLSPPDGNSSATYLGFRDIGQEAASGPQRILHFTRVNSGLIARYQTTTEICPQAETADDTCPPPNPQLLVSTFYDQAYVWNGSGLSAYGAAFDTSNTIGGTQNPSKIVALDVNGDGLTDLFVAASATLLLNTGDGFQSVSYTHDTSGLTLDETVAADYDGDGCDELLIPGSDGDWMRLVWNGTALSAPLDTPVDASGFGANPIVIDSGGRMLFDLVGVDSGDIELALRAGPYPDLVTDITDGLGNYDQPDWISLAESDTVQETFTPGTSFEATHRGHYVVSDYQANDGTGGSYTMSYVYDTPERYVAGGFLGFAAITATDGRDGHTTRSTWGINQYGSHLPLEVTVAQANGDQISDDDYLYTVGFVNPGEPVMLRKWVTTRDDADGNSLYTITRQYTYDTNAESDDAYNLIETETTTADSSGDDTWVSEITQTLANRKTTNDWCNALPSEIDDTETVPNASPVTRETTFTPNTTYCREDAMTTDAGQAKTSTATAYTYDGFGNVEQTAVTGHNADGSAMSACTTQYQYEANGEYLQQVTDPVGDVTGYTWNNAFGLKSSVTAPNGSVTTYVQDGFGLPKLTTLPSGGTESVDYTDCSNGCGFPAGAWTATVSDALASGSAAGAQALIYDRYGRTISVQRELSQGWSEADRTYDSLGQVVWQGVPRYAGGPIYAVQTQYDALGRVTQTMAPASVTNIHGAVTGYTYSGLQTTVTTQPNTASEASTVYTYDPLGEVTDIHDAAGNDTTYAYGPFGTLGQVTGPDGVVSSVSYDTAGHRTQLAAPDLGTTVTLVPDSLGEVTQKRDGSGTLNYTYDKLGRMTEEQHADSSTLISTWSYSHSGNNAGQLYQETREGDYTRNLSYTAQGQVSQDVETYNGTAWYLNYAYDTLGRVSIVRYPATAAANRLRLAYAYDGNGQLASVTDTSNNTVYWQENAGAGVPVQNAWGEPQAWTLGSGTDVERSYDDATGAITGIQAGPDNNATLVDLAYGYDPLGNTTDTNDAVENVSRNMTYDSLNRFKHVTITNPNAPDGLNRGAYYSSGGNITSRVLVGGYTYGENGAPPHAVTTITHQVGATQYSYDAAGRMTSSGAFGTINWNWAGQPSQLLGTTSLYLAYTADGDLLTKSVTGQGQSRYFGTLFVQAGDGSWRERIMANGEVVAIVNVSSAGFTSVNYLVHDNLGSTAVVVDASGNLEGRYAWDGWGDLVNPATGNGSDPDATADEALTSIGYTGHEMFWAAGLIHTHARLYDPSIGRWMSSDPVVPGVDNPQALNRYSYALNNPTTLVDVNGHWPDFPYAPSQQLQMGAYYEYVAATTNYVQAGVGLGEMALGGLGWGLLITGNIPAPGLDTVIAVSSSAGLTDMMFNGWQTFISAQSNQPPPENALSVVMGEGNYDTTEMAITAAEILSDYRNAPFTLIRYLMARALKNFATHNLNAHGGNGSSAGGTPEPPPFSRTPS